MHLHPRTITSFQKKILSRYSIHKRDLPWRDSFDPYKVLVSEVMSQQTQVERVVSKYHNFLNEVPDIKTLADLPKPILLRLRSWLWFNSRALRLQKTAQEIVKYYDSKIPKSRELLLWLPGIWPYTSASICAFAYNISEPVIDTNIRRVLISELWLSIEVSTLELENIGRLCIPEWRSNDRHNALMDYGSLVATSKKTWIKPTSKQSTFAWSDRQVRGWVLKQLVAGNKPTISSITKQFPEKQVSKIISGMKKDWLLKIKWDILSI